MDLLEFEAKEIFQKYQISIPKGEVVKTPEDARRIAEIVGLPVVIKAQVLSGKRGKGGGIKFAKTMEDVENVSAELLGKELYGLKIENLLLYHMVPEGHELYLGFTVDRAAKNYVAIVSSAGGMDIEEVAEQMPEKIVKEHIPPLLGLRSYQALRMMNKIGFRGGKARSLSQMLMKLWDVVRDYDATMAEINPAILTPEGELVAVDARMTIDDNALFRHPEYKERIEAGLTDLTEREIAAQKVQAFYVELDGDIGIIGNGAGLVMATLDVVTHFGGKPTNFLDLGGGAPPERVAKAIEIVTSHPRVKVLFINIFGGITRCDYIAQGILDAQKQLGLEIPMVVRMLGTREDEGRKLLESAGIDVLDTMELAAKRAVKLAAI
ncbi:MAG: ADP-forming succinate--CoA ligase subunit beta [Candidatus Heimdallarchaeota archaeon]